VPSTLAIPIVLRHGLYLLLRPVTPDDSRIIRDGFNQLSNKTRHLRFFRAISQLSDDDLSRLTHVDQLHHVAWGAVEVQPDGLTGAALARFVRDPDDPCLAEFAIVVLDALQSRGVGTVMLALLLVLARSLGLRALQGVVLDDNEVMLGWMRSLGAEVVKEDPLVSVFELPVDSPLPPIPRARNAIHLEEVRTDLQALFDLSWSPAAPAPPRSETTP
jgi:GNAT superfamily N-acetyltransferase